MSNLTRAVDLDNMHTKWNTILDVSKWCAKMKAKLSIRHIGICSSGRWWWWRFLCYSHHSFCAIMFIQLSVCCLWVVCHYVECGRLIIWAFLQFLMRDYNKLFKLFWICLIFCCLGWKRKRNLCRFCIRCEWYSNRVGNRAQNERFNDTANCLLFHFS